MADRDGPDAKDFNSLASSVEDFAIELLEPLKSDDTIRVIFEGEDFGRIAEKVVTYRQKKVRFDLTLPLEDVRFPS